MKKIYLFLFATLLTSKVFAQSEAANYKAASDNFKKYYNAHQPDSVFSMFSTEMKDALPLDKFKITTAQLNAQLGNLTKLEFKSYSAPLAVYKATFLKGSFLLNIKLNAENKLTGLLLTPDNETTVASVPMDPSLTESPVLLKTLSGNISGTLTMPKNATGKVPVVLIIAGSGPTDRNGNSSVPGVSPNTYKLLANDLGIKGIATVRYDKRMIGQSASTQKESDLHIDDYVDDAIGLINMLSEDTRFSKVIVLGHSEGSLIGILACRDEPVSGLISAAGAGDPADKILTEQMKTQPSYLANEFKDVLDSLRKGKLTPNVDPTLYYIARPSIQPYLMSWCKYNPVKEIKRLKTPILILQGTNDIQISVGDAEKLKKAKSDASLVIINGMSHILKDAPADRTQNIATYGKPTLPLNTQLVSTIVDFIQKLK